MMSAVNLGVFNFGFSKRGEMLTVNVRHLSKVDMMLLGYGLH